MACVFSAQIATSKLSAYSSSAIAPYVFSSGLLQSLFGSTVGLWFEQYNAQAVLNAATGELNSGFTPVAIAVATRFIDGLGTPFPTAAFASAVSSATGGSLPTTNIFDVVVCQPSMPDHNHVICVSDVSKRCAWHICAFVPADCHTECERWGGDCSVADHGAWHGRQCGCE